MHTRSNPSADSFNFIVTVPSNPSSTTATPATSSSIVAYIEDTFKVDIISNVIRVRFDSFCTMACKTGIFVASADFYTLYKGMFLSEDTYVFVLTPNRQTFFFPETENFRVA